MDANLTVPQDRNGTFCTRPFAMVRFLQDMFFVVYSFPVNLIVMAELLKRRYKRRKNRSASSTSLSESFLLHISFINTCYCVYILLTVLEELNVLLASRLSLYVLYSPSFTAVPLFYVAICVDSYLAVVHPVAYMTVKKVRHRALLYTTPVWVYTLVMWSITVVYNLPYFHPIDMLSFYVSLPAVMFFSISTLRALYFTRPGGSNQALNPTKRRAFRIILSILIMMVSYYLPQAVFFTYRFIEPTEWDMFLCLEVPLAMLLPTLCKFATPLLFLYSVGKLG